MSIPTHLLNQDPNGSFCHSDIPGSCILYFNKEYLYCFAAGDLFEKQELDKAFYTGRYISDCHTSEESADLLPLCEKVWRGSSFRNEVFLNNKKYTRHLFPAKNESGEIIAGAVFIQEADIHIPSAHADLPRIIERFNLAIESADVGIFDWNIAIDKTYRSPKVWDIFELPDSIEYESFFSLTPFIHPEDYNWLQIILNDLIYNYSEPKRIQYRIYTPDRNIKWIEVSMLVLKDANGTPARLIGTVQDISAKKEIEEKLFENEQIFKVLFKHSYQFNCIFQVNGNIREINHEALIRNNFSSSTQPNVLIWDLPILSYSDLTVEKLKSYVSTCSEGVTVRFEVRFRLAEDMVFDFSIKPVLDRDGVVRLLMMEGREITAIVKASEKAVETARLIQVQNTQLEEFAHITSHNLRSPVINTKMLLELWETAATAEEKDFILSKLKQSTNHLVSTIDTLALNLQIRQQKDQLKERIYFEEIFELVKTINSAILIHSNPTIQTDFSSAPTVDFPRLYLESILQNLLTNSIKYSSRKRALTIHLRSYTEHNRTVLEFSDNGIGMDLAKTKGKLFGLYKTFHSNSDARGVGLFMTKTQLESTGGSIDVLSEVDKGTTFIMKF